MNMTRKRSPRKKRLDHRRYFTFDLWTAIVTVNIVSMITSSCALAISYQNTTIITNKSNQEQSVTEKQESLENYTNVTEPFDSIHINNYYKKQNDVNVLNSQENVTSNLNNTMNSEKINIVQNVTTEHATSKDFETIPLKAKVSRENNLNGSIVSVNYNFETNVNNNHTKLTTNESIINLNEDLRNVNMNNYTDESISTTKTISKDVKCELCKVNEEDSTKDSSISHNSYYLFTNKSINEIPNKADNKLFDGNNNIEMMETDKAKNDLLNNNRGNSTNYDTFNGHGVDINRNNASIKLEMNTKLPDRTRSAKRLGRRGNKKNYEMKSRLYENSVIKNNSEKGNTNLLSSLSETTDYCNHCRDSNRKSSNLKSDSFVVGSKSDITRNRKVMQIRRNYENGNALLNLTANHTDLMTNSNQINESTKIIKITKNQTMPHQYRDEGAFYAIRVLAQGVLESVAERVVPSGWLDIFRRMQNQSTALESERLRSKNENGGIGNWGRSIFKSVITDPLNQLMQGVKDDGSLDSNRNFLSGVASGVVYVADSVAESFKDRVKAIYPGTLWCGDGDVARSDELGLFFLTDMCCKNHDTCKHYIPAGGTKFGLVNTGIFSRSHCNCDKAFYRCLKKTSSIISTQIGVTFFSILGPQCFKKDYPILRCVRRTRLTGQKCEEYELDETQPKIWQWFDSPTF